jgi:UDP-glucose 4-epimerase
VNVFVTGGAGYIGSHVCLELLQANHEVVVFDNFSNSQPESLRRVQALAEKPLTVVQGDIRDQSALVRAMRAGGCTAVIHLAGLKAVGESVVDPLQYYDNNVAGTVCLLRAMQSIGLDKLVFSSSATVYGEPEYLPLTEDHRLAATNPYGRSKLMIESLLSDLYQAQPNWRIVVLRYFNPVGAHESGQIGESPLGTPNNLMPFVAQVASGQRDMLHVYGGDYPTPDGTGLRDYIHVTDLSAGHIQALAVLERPQCTTLNLGTGRGYGVLDVIQAYERASGKKIAYRMDQRRPGDVAACYADPRLAEELLGWKATRDLDQMCIDSWRWQQANPNGYV